MEGDLEQDTEDLGSWPEPGTNVLCGLGQVTQPLWTSIFFLQLYIKELGIYFLR